MRKHEPIDPATNLPPEALPEGLSLDPKTGVISGMPKEEGRYFIRLTANNEKGAGITTLLLVIK